MSVDEIAALPISGITDTEGTHLYLWTPDQFLVDGSGKRVAEAWGFTVGRILLFWKKRNYGLGAFPRPQHEAVLICKRGNLRWLRRDVGSVQEWPQTYGPAGRSVAKINSAKPPAFHDLVESVSPGPYLELFARSQRLGWDTWGNEALEHVTIESTA